jgi:hypothetical protein
MPKWNPQDLRRLVGEHTVVGYRVSVPVLGKSTIELQIRPERGGFVFYKVRADKAVSFKDFAEDMRVSAEPLSIQEWRKKFVKGSGSFPVMAYDLREQLEGGGKVSQADVLFRDLVDRGCIDLDQNVFCYTFPSSDVFIDKPERGQLVEIWDIANGVAGWPSVYLGKKGKYLGLFQQLSPAPYMRTPEALLPADVEKSYMMPVTWTLGYGLAHALEDVGAGLPSGTWSEDKEDYVLDRPIPISQIERFCKDPQTWKKLGQGENIFCLQQAMMLHTLPLVMKEILLRPLPEGTPPDDVVVDIGEIDDPEAGDISFPE